MKRFLILITLSLILTSLTFAQPNCNVSKYFEDFIKIEKVTHGGQVYLVKRVVEADPGICMAPLVKNTMYIDYLLTNFSGASNYQDLLKIPDTLLLQQEYIKSLQHDTLFIQVMSDLVAKTIDKRIPKDSISMDKILNVAVKYFAILKITEDGYYTGKVCAGLNDIKKTEKVRKPQLEAFCFSSILKNYQGTEFNMYDEFVKSIKELYKVNLGVDNSERLLRAQGAMYFLMRNSENLKNMLRSEYELNKDILPFILKN